ncbi:MAG: BamA/TamA family outer membrane protein [Saprospiraceae bacterium]|nr:BamA/TamA family outer membrane protein [Saprospiraceae bacterium]
MRKQKGRVLNKVGVWRCGLLLVLGCMVWENGMSQSTVASDTTFRVFGVPIAFYTPDTRLGLGAAGIVSFRAKDAPQRSSITFSMAYTLRKQWLSWFPYQIYWDKGRKLAYGEVGYYRYIYQFFGVGNRIPNNYLESYQANYPRIRLTALQQLNRNNFVGFRYSFDQYRVAAKTPGGLLEQGIYTGSNGGRSSGLGAVWFYDTRDNRFFPKKGATIEITFQADAPWTGSVFNFQRLTAEAALFRTLFPKHVLGINPLLNLGFGPIPFFLLHSLGGPKKLRGYKDGKFRDQNMALIQTEWRSQWLKRWGTVAFAGVGTVWGTPGEPIVLRPNYGLGIRFTIDPKQQVNIRMDYGFGSGSQGFYFTVGEAF